VRIAQVCPYSLSIPGGVQGQVLGLASSLRRIGHDVTVLAPTDTPPSDPGVRSLGPTVPLSANGSIARIAPGLASVRRTMAALKDGRYDVVHVHEPLVPGPAMASLLYDLSPMIGTFHRSGASHAYAAFDPLVRRWARRLVVRCAVSPEALATAEAALGGTYELVFNAVDIEPYVAAEPRPTSGPTIFFIGRHEERKGLAVLLEAWTRLPPGTRCWVAGTGPDTAALQARFSGVEGLEWLGRISDEERAPRMKGADVVCVPSLHGESFGVVLLEAMAAGSPVVASDLPGYRTVATDGVDALLVPPGDPGALANALRRALDDRGLAAKLVEAGRRRADELSMDRLAAVYVGFYERAREHRARAVAAR
jgi:phosphatidylinositol alpha-mannosyltransferase